MSSLKGDHKNLQRENDSEPKVAQLICGKVLIPGFVWYKSGESGVTSQVPRLPKWVGEPD